MHPSKLAYEGEKFSIEFFINQEGNCPTEEWLEVQSLKVQHKFAALFAMLADIGKIFNEQKFKHMSGTNQLFEFKVDQGRVLCFFFIGKRIILTHGFVKKSNKTPRGEIERAEILKSDFIQRSKK